MNNVTYIHCFSFVFDQVGIYLKDSLYLKIILPYATSDKP